MALSKSDFFKLISMQALLNELESLCNSSPPLLKSRIQEIYQQLSQLYTTDWLRITESEALDAEERHFVEILVPKDRYSIFWQDTIWNSLEEAARLLKSKESP